MRHFCYWSLAAYIVSYAAVVLAVRYDWHKAGCFICNEYGEPCPCNYLMKWPDQFIKWIGEAIDREASIAALVILLGLPVLAWTALLLTHVIFPIHRKSCLASILEGENSNA